MELLSTDRLTLRGWTPADVDFAFDLYSRWQVQQFIGTTPRVLVERAEARAQVERFMALDDPVHGIWLVAERGTGQRLGTLLLKPIPASGPELRPSGETEIGWHLHPDSWGRGVATEAAGRVLSHAFAGGLPQVVAVTHVDNHASQRVARRIGMAHRGATDRFYNATCELFVAGAELAG